MLNRRLLVLGGFILACFMAARPVLAGQKLNPTTRSTGQSVILLGRISTGSSGRGGGTYAAISGNGQFVAYESAANDLVSGQISGSWDTLVYNRTARVTQRVSTRTGGAAVFNPGDYTSPPSISADGRYVAFMSRAENLVSNDANLAPDIFVHDRVANTTELISVSLSGKSGNDGSYTPAISADGRFVAFQSFASDLVQGDTNNSLDVFVRDRQTGVTELVSVTDSGAQGSDFHDYGFPGVAISGDGRYVAFSYQNLPVGGQPGSSGPNVYLRDRTAKTTRLVAAGDLPALSADGRYVGFVTSAGLTSDDKNSGPDVYVWDRTANRFERVSLPSGGSDPANAIILDPPSLSADGRYVAFATTAPLVAADNNSFADIYLRDRQSRKLKLISVGTGGAANNESHNPALSADGSLVAFTSLASNLVAGDTNGLNDVFVASDPPAVIVPQNNRIYLPLVVR